MLGNRYSQHSFAQIPDVHIQRSSFDRSFTVKDTFDFDYLVPIFLDEILPGDTCNVNVNTFARLATQKVPIMDNMYVDYFFFFVPNRLVWDNWEKFNGAQENPGDTTSYQVPVIQFATGEFPTTGTIYDKMGLPCDLGGSATMVVNSLPLRCYNLIWNEWFRDQNLQDSVLVSKDDGPDDPEDFTLLKRNKRHDYFTSCLPDPQKGVAIEIPLSGTASITRVSNALSWRAYNTTSETPGADGATSLAGGNGTIVSAATGLSFDPRGGLQANLGTASNAVINELREAFQLQSLFELDNRGGTRYVEILRAHFNVTSPDFRLQRPEYLGGGQSRINVHSVPQSSPTSGTNYQAQLAAFGTMSASGNQIGFTKSFVEHGYVIGLACARADITYQQGYNRLWLRTSRFTFYWPKLAELGEQGVYKGELYTTGTPLTDVEIFGYQERWAEYRYKPSEIHGEFRSSFASSLDFWHLAEEFGTQPELNSDFIEQNTPIERCLASSTAPHLLFDAWFQYKHARPLPVYSVPMSLGRF